MIQENIIAEVLYDGRVKVEDLFICADDMLEYSITATLNQIQGTSYNIEDLTDHYNILEKKFFTLNIYKFISECKEWAAKKGYSFYSGYDISNKKFKCIQGDIIINTWYEDTELEAILKGCEWVLEQA